MTRRRPSRLALLALTLLTAASVGLAAPAEAASVPGWWKPKAVPNPTTGSHSFRDFHKKQGTYDGLVVGQTAFRGKGVRRSTLRMVAHSSTLADRIPSAFPDTNQLSLVRLKSTVTSFAGFTIAATAQGHLYNGLRIDKTRSVHIHDVRIAGIKGNDDAPPGETFGLNDYKTVGSRYSRVEVDGKGKGASGFGANGSKRITIRNSYVHGEKYAMGYAFWHVRTITMRRDIAAHNGWAGFNFERVSGTVRLDHIVSHDNRVDIRIASDLGTATYRIVDPTYDGSRLVIQIPRTYYKRTNRQVLSRIHLIVHGRERPDLISFVR